MAVAPAQEDGAQSAIVTPQGLTQWIQGRAKAWQRMAANTAAAHGSGRIDGACAKELLSAYRSVSRDLALVQRTLPNSRLLGTVSALFYKLHELIHRAPMRPFAAVRDLYLQDVPRVLRRLRMPIWYTSVGFIIAGLIGWLLVASFPELASLFASEQMISKVQAGKLWTDDLLNVMPSSLLSLGIFTNNAVVALMAFSLGAFFGVGTIYIIGLNGLMLGGVFAFTHQYGLSLQLFEFVIAHGVVELSIICLAGAAGTLLGEALARPGLLTRRESFRRAATSGAQLLFACIPLLFVCGLIEGYVSPNPAFPLWSRVAIGLGWALVAYSLLTGRLLPRRILTK